MQKHCFSQNSIYIACKFEYDKTLCLASNSADAHTKTDRHQYDIAAQSKYDNVAMTQRYNTTTNENDSNNEFAL